MVLLHRAQNLTAALHFFSFHSPPALSLTFMRIFPFPRAPILLRTESRITMLSLLPF